MSIRPDPQRAERNLRALAENGIRAGLHVVQAYPQDLVDILRALDQARDAAVSALEISDPASQTAMRAMVAGARR